MSEDTPINGWRTFRFDQMATIVNDRVDDPSQAKVDHYVGLEHLDSDSLTIRRWGSPTDVNATKLYFRAGDIIFGRRRVYQRKLGVARFDGICSAHAMVLRARPEVVLPEFLPFFMQTDSFMQRAKEISVGSLSPTINWTTLATQKFVLPPLEEQQKIAITLDALDRLSIALDNVRLHHEQLVASSLQGLLRKHEAASVKIGDIAGRVTNGFVGSAVKHYVPKGIPYLRSLNIRRSGITFNDLVYISDSFHKAASKSQLREGDLLTVQSGHVGETAVVPAKCENWNCHALILTRLDRERALPEYVAMFLNSSLGQQKLTRLYVGTTVAHLNTSDLAELEIPLPNVDRQQNIIDRVSSISRPAERIFSRIADLKALRQHVTAMLSMTKPAK